MLSSSESNNANDLSTNNIDKSVDTVEIFDGSVYFPSSSTNSEAESNKNYQNVVDTEDRNDRDSIQEDNSGNLKAHPQV